MKRDDWEAVWLAEQATAQLDIIPVIGHYDCERAFPRLLATIAILRQSCGQQLQIYLPRPIFPVRSDP
jgi:hypothetical protein